MADLLRDLDLFYRLQNPAQAHVYARLPFPLENGKWSLTGRVRGPYTSRGHTLPTTARFEAFGNAGYLLERATIVDPCSWSPASPHLYEVTVELRRNDEVAATTTRKLGLRDLRPQRNSLYLDAKRWVLRGMHADETADPALAWWDASAVRVISFLDETWLAQAARDGVMTVIRLDQRSDWDEHTLRQIARFASAAMVVLPNPAKMPDDIRLFVPNLLLAQRVSDQHPLAAWPHAAWIDVDSGDFAAEVRTLQLPIIAVRRGRFASLTEARAACDALQADLAPLGQFAGYVV